MTVSTKPCIECGKECEILPVQLGDSFTLTYLRVCGPECMFIVAYDYLYEIGYHKEFRNKLYDKQNEEDKVLRDEFIDTTTEMYLESLKKRLEANPGLLTTPTPNCITDLFASVPSIPSCSSTTTRFTRLTKDEKIKWARQRVQRLQEDLLEAQLDLAKEEND